MEYCSRRPAKPVRRDCPQDSPAIDWVRIGRACNTSRDGGRTQMPSESPRHAKGSRIWVLKKNRRSNSRPLRLDHVWMENAKEDRRFESPLLHQRISAKEIAALDLRSASSRQTKARLTRSESSTGLVRSDRWGYAWRESVV